MAILSVRLPNSVHKSLKQLAEREGISINMLIASAVAEKMAALEAETYIQNRAAKGNRTAFEVALGQVPALEPMPGDAL
jgi:predicted DNA-binding ribbon-helix-helix protein